MQAVPIAERTSIETARRHTVGRHQRIPRIKAPRNRESPRMPSKRAIVSARSTFGPSYFDSSDDRVRSSRFMPGLSRRERRQSTLPLRSQGYSRANFLFCFLNSSLIGVGHVRGNIFSVGSNGDLPGFPTAPPPRAPIPERNPCISRKDARRAPLPASRCTSRRTFRPSTQEPADSLASDKGATGCR